MKEQKIKQDEIHIGENIRRIRISQKMKQTELALQVQLLGVELTRETLVKIERGTQHLTATQLSAIRSILKTTYEALLESRHTSDRKQ